MEDMDSEDEEAWMAALGDSSLVVLPGEEITKGGGFLRGHGTFLERLSASERDSGEFEDDDGDDVLDSGHGGGGGGGGRGVRLVASVAGPVLRVNKLISVQPLRTRYGGDVGDVVVGRIVEVGNKQWKVDLGSRQTGTLMLGSINLPGGALRRRTIEDQLQMRTLFKENDMVSAEVASFYQHGGMAVHTRSMRYGKLENGLMVVVPPSLMKRLSQHFVRLPCGVDAIFALNGRIWLSAARDAKPGETTPAGGPAAADPEGPSERDRLEEDAAAAADVVERMRKTELMEVENKLHAESAVEANVRQAMARVRNAIALLAKRNRLIFPDAVMQVFQVSLQLDVAAKDMLTPDIADTLIRASLAASSKA